MAWKWLGLKRAQSPNLQSPPLPAWTASSFWCQMWQKGWLCLSSGSFLHDHRCFLKCKFLEVNTCKSLCLEWLDYFVAVCLWFIAEVLKALNIWVLHVWMLFVLMDFVDGCNISAPAAGGDVVSSLLLENIALGRRHGGGNKFKADIICGVPYSVQWNTKRELMTR